MITIDPTDQEVFNFMRVIAPNSELKEGLTLDLKSRFKVCDLIKMSTSKEPPSLRMLVRGLNTYAAAIKEGLSFSDAEMARFIQTYA